MALIAELVNLAERIVRENLDVTEQIPDIIPL